MVCLSEAWCIELGMAAGGNVNVNPKPLNFSTPKFAQMITSSICCAKFGKNPFTGGFPTNR